ncbi:MAG: hypothetical protein K940chlam7_01246 [Chlamydiae bacterium]|nr:hypothetical protein [Chlamydiota bacterium]
MAESSKNTNRLINEKSPYLLQHAHNPVDWYPWGEEAINTAQVLDMPIFLSIGYATCHWCHVMETESFEDPEVAKLLNETFINIKVDREELPEVDSLYMEFAQSMMAGAAGWPLNMVLTPNLEPFFATTYLPPHSTDEMMGLADLILRIREVWNSEEREKVISQAEKIVEVFEENNHTEGEEIPAKEYIDATIELIYKMTDPVYGGMKGAPKFPIGYQTNILLEYSSFANDSRALFVAERTLDMMQRGGIYDHLGGGFSRYSIDEQWLVPHFEKMLYDNALLSHSYLQVWKLTKRDLYREVCDDIIQYVLRDMTHPEGGYYSAQDADSEGREGFYYTWTVQEIEEILGEEKSRLFCDFFDVKELGNFEGRNVLHTAKRAEEYAIENNLDVRDFENQITEMKQKVWMARGERVPPLKDDKILSSWNGLMIFSIVEAGCALKSRTYIESGIRAAQFVRNNLWEGDRLLRRWRDGEAHFNAGLDEYAFLVRGLLSLFEAGCGNEWLAWAMEITNLLKEKFKMDNGGYYQTDGTDPFLILRKCQFSDGAEPSGNAIHCENLLRLYQLTYNQQYLEDAEDTFRAVQKYIDTYSPEYSYHVLNLIRYFNPKAPTIVVALNEHKDFQSEIHEKIFSSFVPHRAVIWAQEGDEELCSLLPHIKGQVAMNGNTTVYICHNRICEKPLTDINETLTAIENL